MLWGNTTWLKKTWCTTKETAHAAQTEKFSAAHHHAEDTAESETKSMEDSKFISLILHKNINVSMWVGHWWELFAFSLNQIVSLKWIVEDIDVDCCALAEPYTNCKFWTRSCTPVTFKIDSRSSTTAMRMHFSRLQKFSNLLKKLAKLAWTSCMRVHKRNSKTSFAAIPTPKRVKGSK